MRCWPWPISRVISTTTGWPARTGWRRTTPPSRFRPGCSGRPIWLPGGSSPTEGAGRAFGLSIVGRRGEAANFDGEQPGKFDRSQVVALRRDDLHADRQAVGGEAERCRRRRQIGKARQPGPEQLLLILHELVIDRNHALFAVRIMIVREGCGGGD